MNKLLKIVKLGKTIEMPVTNFSEHRCPLCKNKIRKHSKDMYYCANCVAMIEIITK